MQALIPGLQVKVHAGKGRKVINGGIGFIKSIPNTVTLAIRYPGQHRVYYYLMVDVTVLDTDHNRALLVEHALSPKAEGE